MGDKLDRTDLIKAYSQDFKDLDELLQTEYDLFKLGNTTFDKDLHHVECVIVYTNTNKKQSNYYANHLVKRLYPFYKSLRSR